MTTGGEMAEAGRLKWLELVPGSDSFRTALGEQLSAELRDKTGINIREGFMLMPADESFEARFTDKGVGYFDADLVGPDAYGERVRAAWMDASGGGRRIAPESDVPPNTLRAWWSTLPSELLRRRYAEPVNTAPYLKAEPNVPLDWSGFAWPDVWIELETEREPTAREVEGLLHSLEAFRTSLNANPEGRVIHNWSGPRRLGPRRYEMHIDFGSADPPALGQWLTVLSDQASDWGIKRISVRGHPAESTQ